MKMFVTPNFVQHNRLIRLVMLLIVVGLSIFLYTSYYANQTMERFPTSQRFHMPSLISVSSILEAEASASAAGTGNAIDDDNTFQSNGINDKTGIDSSNSNNNNNGLVQPAESASIDTSNDSQIRQQLLGNNLNDNLSNSVAQFNVNNIVQQTNLPGEFLLLFFLVQSYSIPYSIHHISFICVVLHTQFAFRRSETFTKHFAYFHCHIPGDGSNSSDLPSSSSLSLPASIAAAAINQPKNLLNNSNESHRF